MPLISATQAQIVRLRSLIAIEQRGGVRTGVPQGFNAFECVVVSATVLSGEVNRYEYIIRQSTFDPATMLPVILDDAPELTAYNCHEDGNTDTIVAPGYDLTSLPDDWAMYAVSYMDGGRIEPYTVMAWFGGYKDGAPFFRFSAPNLIDGPCPPPASESA